MSVDFTFKRLYPTEEVGSRIEEVTKTLQNLYEKYSKDHRAKASKAAVGSTTAAVRTRKNDDFYAFLKSRDVENPSKSDLKVYLGEPRFVVEDEESSFDVLKWWSQNYSKFPILSKLARDVLCIPITTVASESTFSAGGRVLNDYPHLKKIWWRF
jgi:hAT family C-terminal dimerisation region